MSMQEIPIDTDSLEYTQCDCCKRWGWENDDVQKFHKSSDGDQTIELCEDCINNDTEFSEAQAELESWLLPPELWATAQKMIADAEAERQQPDAEVIITMKLTNTQARLIAEALKERADIAEDATPFENALSWFPSTLRKEVK